jgi:aryl-alcohol dehydrogenase-like predicted oxidoreductase
MEYRPFGQTGIEISAVGFGCWEIGGGYGSIEEDEFIKAVNRALDVGINCFDTAEAYGMGVSERSLAKALGSRRNEAVASASSSRSRRASRTWRPTTSTSTWCTGRT